MPSSTECGRVVLGEKICCPGLHEAFQASACKRGSILEAHKFTRDDADSFDERVVQRCRFRSRQKTFGREGVMRGAQSMIRIAGYCTTNSWSDHTRAAYCGGTATRD